MSKKKTVCVEGLTNEALCYIYQHAETEEEKTAPLQELLKRFEPLIVKRATAARFRSSRGTFDMEDLLQEGRLCLICCAGDYQERICPVFAVYADRYISWKISDYYFSGNDVIRPHSSKAKRGNSAALKSRVEYSLDGLPPESADKACIPAREKPVSVEDCVLTMDEHSRLREALDSRLTERERHVLVERFVNGTKCETLARELGVHRNTVGNVTRAGLSKLRAAVG